jgi:outer membrane lipoprotein-sorting protein
MKNATVFLFALLLTGLHSGCQAGKQADAVALVQKTKAAYAKCKSFQCDVSVTVTDTFPTNDPSARVQVRKVSGEIRFQRPDHFRILWLPEGGMTNAIYESGGKVMMAGNGYQDGKYEVLQPAGYAGIGFAPTESVRNKVVYFPTPSSAGLYEYVPLLLTHIEEPLQFPSLTKGRDEVVNGTACHVVVGKYNGAAADYVVTFLIAKETGLLAQVRKTSVFHRLKPVFEVPDRPAAKKALPARTDWVVTYSGVKVDAPLDKAALEFVPPAEALIS